LSCSSWSARPGCAPSTRSGDHLRRVIRRGSAGSEDGGVTERYDAILLLERGDFLTRETDNWDPGAVFVDAKYLYVVDTSFFPSIGAVNPGPHRDGQRHPGRRAPAQPDVIDRTRIRRR
jgi:hypothetical protein